MLVSNPNNRQTDSYMGGEDFNRKTGGGELTISGGDYLDHAKETLSRLQELQNRAQEAVNVAHQHDKFVVDLSERLSTSKDVAANELINTCLEALNRFEALHKSRLKRQNEFIRMLEDVYSQKVILLKQLAGLRAETVDLNATSVQKQHPTQEGSYQYGDKLEEIRTRMSPTHPDIVQSLINSDPVPHEVGNKRDEQEERVDQKQSDSPLFPPRAPEVCDQQQPISGRRDSVRSLDHGKSIIGTAKPMIADLSTRTGNMNRSPNFDLPPMMMAMDIPPPGKGTPHSAVTLTGVNRYPKSASVNRYQGLPVIGMGSTSNHASPPTAANNPSQPVPATPGLNGSTTNYQRTSQQASPNKKLVGGSMNEQKAAFVEGSIIDKEDELNFDALPPRGEALAFLYDN